MRRATTTLPTLPPSSIHPTNQRLFVSHQRNKLDGTEGDEKLAERDKDSSCHPENSYIRPLDDNDEGFVMNNVNHNNDGRPRYACIFYLFSYVC
jgi:hypothetical protein